MISAKLLSDYRKALTTVVETGADLMARTYQSLLSQGVSEAVMRDAMLQAAWGAASDLGNLASVAAADFYERLRFDQLPPGLDFQAWLADLPDYQVVQQQAHMSARFLFDREGPNGRVYQADPEMFVRELMTNIERLILDAARDTILESGRRDPLQPRVAVLARADACEYCQRAMSEGWLVPADAGRTTGIFHDHCRCITAPSWDLTPQVQGLPQLPVPRPEADVWAGT